jgi:hypothetical protein
MTEGLSKPNSNESHVLISDGIKYSVNKLIKIAETRIPEEIAISEFDKSMETECWDDSEGRKVNPKEVLEAIGGKESEYSGLKQHIEQVKNSDIKHPVLVTNIDGELVVLDGMHRLVKSFLEKKVFVSVIKFDSLPKEAQILE